MWQLVEYKYAEDFVPSGLTEFFHSWPHVTYRGLHTYASKFDPDDERYVQTLIFWGAIPILWLTATLLFIIMYGICQCCKNKRRQAHPVPNRRQRTTCLTWVIITIALFSVAFVGGGFYGNETTASGMQHFVQSAQNANDQIGTTENEIDEINTGITTDLAGEVKKLEEIFQKSQSNNESLKHMLLEETATLQRMVVAAGGNISNINATYTNNLNFSTIIADVKYYETFRWVGLIIVFCFELFICLMVLFGTCTRNRCSLVSSAILCVIGIVLVWCLAGAELFVTVGLSDFCNDPDQFVEKEARKNADLSDDFLLYYIECGKTPSPYIKGLSSANKDLALADSMLDGIAEQAKGHYDKAEPVIKAAGTILNTVSSSLLLLGGNLDCASGLHKDYVTALYSVCYDGVLGVVVMLLSMVLTGILFTSIILCTINLNGRLPKRKYPYAVDQEDPFLPPNDNNATLERYRRNVEPPRERDNPPAPLPSDHRARPISLSSSLQGYSHEPGPSTSNQQWPAARGPGSSAWGAGAAGSSAAPAASNQPSTSREGYDSPPPSYTMAMSRDNQRRTAENRQRSQLNSGSIV